MIAKEWVWILAFAVVDFSNRVAFGAMSMMGPAQPYLAKNIGVSIKTFSILWSFGKCSMSLFERSMTSSNS